MAYNPEKSGASAKCTSPSCRGGQRSLVSGILKMPGKLGGHKGRPYKNKAFRFESSTVFMFMM